MFYSSMVVPNDEYESFVISYREFVPIRIVQVFPLVVRANGE